MGEVLSSELKKALWTCKIRPVSEVDREGWLLILVGDVQSPENKQACFS